MVKRKFDIGQLVIVIEDHLNMWDELYGDVQVHSGEVGRVIEFYESAANTCGSFPYDPGINSYELHMLKSKKKLLFCEFELQRYVEPFEEQWDTSSISAST